MDCENYIKHNIKKYTWCDNDLSTYLLDTNKYIIQQYINDIYVSTFYNINIHKCLMEYIEKHNIIFNIHCYDEKIFRNACIFGRINTIKYILDYSEKINSRINIHVYDDKPFMDACMLGHPIVVKYLIYYSEKINSKIYILHDNIYLQETTLQLKSLHVIEYLVYLARHNYENLKNIYKGNIRIINRFITIKYIKHNKRKNIYIHNNNIHNKNNIITIDTLSYSLFVS